MAGKKGKPAKAKPVVKEQKAKPLTTTERMSRIVEGNDPGYRLP